MQVTIFGAGTMGAAIGGRCTAGAARCYHACRAERIVAPAGHRCRHGRSRPRMGGDERSDPVDCPSGEGARSVVRLGGHGLDIHPLPEAVREAAALKMCYAALNKELTALTTAVLLASHKAGVADELLAKFGTNQKFLL